MFCLRSSDVVISATASDSSRQCGGGGSAAEGIDLPSPASSTVESDTSDYPRSTPSPRDHDSGIGSLEEFSDSKDTDPGLGDELLPSEEYSSVSSSRKDVLRKVRVALEKLPQRDESPPPPPSNKLPYDEDEDIKASGKRLKLEDVQEEESILSEMKQHYFKALRKEKLDRVLNLKTDDKAPSKKRNTPKLLVREPLLTSDVAFKKETEEEEQSKESGTDNHQFEVPKAVLRFPSRTSSGIQCRWDSCGLELESSGKLIDHLKTKHASLQIKEETTPKYRCLWEGCKVYGKTSCSKSWLEKHIISHGGNKPFQCIVDGCKQRFSTQSLLERHVNSHFKSSSSQQHPNGSAGSSGPGTHHPSGSTEASSGHPISSSSSSNGSSISASSAPKTLPKVIKKAGRKLKYRKTIFSARIFDLFDIGIMAQVQERLVHLERNPICRVVGESITLSGSIIAKKRDASGRSMFLMRWTPHNLLDDEWVEKSTVSSFKTIRISSLPPCSKESLSRVLFAQNTPRHTHRNQRKFNRSCVQWKPASSSSHS